MEGLKFILQEGILALLSKYRDQNTHNVSCEKLSRVSYLYPYQLKNRIKVQDI